MKRFGKAALVASLALVVGAPLAFAAKGGNPNGGNPEKPGYFTCSAAALRVTPEGGDPIEVSTAGGDGPCESGHEALAETPAGAPIYAALFPATTEAQARGAEAAAEAATVSAGPLDITVLGAWASGQCQDNSQGHPTARRPVLSGGSEVLSIENEGEEQVPSQVNEDRPPLGVEGVATVNIADEERSSSTGRDRGESIAERALVVETVIGDATVAEAEVGYVGQPCAPGQTKE